MPSVVRLVQLAPLIALVAPLCAPLLAAPVPTPAEEIVANGRKKLHYQIPRADAPIRIDGVLDEEVWQRGLVLDINNEIDPGKNIPAPVTTVAYLLYDDDNLYAAFRADDPEPQAIRAHLADRDTPFRDDWVGLLIDTFNDDRNGYELFVNPLGVQMDLALNEVSADEEEDAAWDAIWSSAGRIDDRGYVVEIAIPFSSLRFQRSEGEQTWGLAPIRSYPRSRRHQILASTVDPNDNCLLCQIPKVTGFAGATPGRNLEFDPTLTAHRTDVRERFPDGSLKDGDPEADVGLTARWGITPNLTFSGAVNPDFSQVEADAAQLDVNTQFALFFPEKRPFFLEGSDFFDSYMNVVHTRTVADPSWGVKLTGKEGKNGLGVFVAEDEVTNLLLPGSQRSGSASLDLATTDAVFRYRRDLGSNSDAGVLVTHREGEGYRNSVYGADGLWRPTPSDSLRLQVLESQTEYPDAFAVTNDLPRGAFDGRALRAGYSHDSREWNWYGRYEDIDPGFRADLGFLPQVGYTMQLAGVERRWWGDTDDWYTRIIAGTDWNRSEAPDGALLEDELEAWAGVGGPLQSFYFLDLGHRKRTWNGRLFEGSFLFYQVEMRPTGELYLLLEGNLAETIDLANTRPADRIEIRPSVTWNVGRHLQLGLDHVFQRLDVDDGRLLEANLTQLRTVYQLNIRTFVRAILQYESLDRNPDLFSQPVSKDEEQLFTQLLFSYKLNPQTVLFLGYSDNSSGAELPERTIELTRSDRTLFFKVGYALVL
ncbi:MAG: DUF5916 domain-containing protein [Acidobacteriota bacterium]